jgi:hypothetical protein
VLGVAAVLASPVGASIADRRGTGESAAKIVFGRSVGSLPFAPTANGSAPQGVEGMEFAFDSANGNFYTTDPANDSLHVINGSTRQVVGAPIPIPGSPNQIVFDSGNGELYVAEVPPEVYGQYCCVVAVDPNTDAVVPGLIPAQGDAAGMVYDSDNGNIYLSNHGTNNFTIINGSNDKVLPVSPFLVSPGVLAFDPRTNEIYAAAWNYGGSGVVNATSNTLEPPSDNLFLGNRGLAYDPLSDRLYAGGAGSVLVIDPNSKTTMAVADPGITAGDVVVAGSSGLFYVATTVLETSNDSVDGPTLPVAPIPGSYDPATGWVFAYRDDSGPPYYMQHALVAVRESEMVPTTFVEAGLPTGVPWQVTISDAFVLGGEPTPTYRTEATNVSFTAHATVRLWNGTYDVSAAALSGSTDRAGASWSGLANVSGLGSSVGFDFAPFLTTMEFREVGLPSGTNWTVHAAGANGSFAASSVASAQWLNLSGQNVTATVSASDGYLPNASSYTFHFLSASPAPLTIEFHAASLLASTPLVVWLLLGGGALLLAVLAVERFRARSRSREHAPESDGPPPANPELQPPIVGR